MRIFIGQLIGLVVACGLWVLVIESLSLNADQAFYGGLAVGFLLTIAGSIIANTYGGPK
jgi:hypothetical protein